MVDVFISYARQERDSAEQIKAKLAALKLDLFFDIQGIDGGAEFPAVITRALDRSKAVLACCSPVYFTRPWCLSEAQEGATRGILVPVMFERFERTAPPVNLRSLNVLDLTDWSGKDEHEDWNRTLQALGKLVGRELAPPLEKGLFGGVKAVGEAPTAPQAVSAHADIVVDLRETWRNFPARGDEAAVEKFLVRVREAAPGSGLEFEVEHHLHGLHRDRAEHEAREVAFVENERRERPRRAAKAARSGGPVAERVYPLELPGVSGWPNPQMIAVPPGRFFMGTLEQKISEETVDGYLDRAKERLEYLWEFPQHCVQIEYALSIARHAVTFQEWDAALEDGATLNRPKDLDWGRGERPAIFVSWDDAQAFLAWLNERSGLSGKLDAYRLPSEAEWEYACRAGTSTQFSFGETISTAQANYDGNYTYGGGARGEYRQKTMPVGSFPCNAFGLYELHGNIWEWCEDSWKPNYTDAPSNGSAFTNSEKSSRVLRGGSWSEHPIKLRSASRSARNSGNRFNDQGFRLARTVMQY